MTILAAHDPKTNKLCYFVDKCLPCGASISCSHFQRFSNGLAHVMKYLVEEKNLHFTITNYLDDFLFITNRQHDCNKMVRIFIDMCNKIRLPLSLNKTEWASKRIVFLGILIEGTYHVLSVPEEKRVKAINSLRNIKD